MIVTFSVPFVQGKMRPRFFRRGRHTGTYTPEETKQAMADIAQAYKDAALGKCCHVPKASSGTSVTVAITTAKPLPQSRPKRVVRESDTYKPDADNTAKLVLDGLNGVAWDDDTQVTQLHVFKLDRSRFRDRPVTHVMVMWKEED
jgi:Holliday junction resolvase RusA-like endonuclease